MADAEAEQQPRRIEADPRLDRGEEIVDRLLLPALAADQLAAMVLEAEDVGGAFQPAELDEFDQAFLAEAVDVHRHARDEMPKALDALCGADQAAGAADVDLAFRRHRLAAALRAMVR